MCVVQAWINILAFMKYSCCFYINSVWIEEETPRWYISCFNSFVYHFSLAPRWWTLRLWWGCYSPILCYYQATFSGSSHHLVLPAAYRWIGCIALCCMVVLVLAFNYLGLLCGTLGYDKHASPTTRGCISNTGGTMLMAWVTVQALSVSGCKVPDSVFFVFCHSKEFLIC